MSIFNVLSLIGGLALFLFGMNYMGSSLERLGGGKFESILERMTNSRIKGVLLGAAVTGVIQSSSAVTVMAVGFVNSGIMDLHQVIGIIMGANIGTTVTAWLLSLTGIKGGTLFLQLLKPSSFTPVLAVIGLVMYMFTKSDKKKNIGSILIGFSVLMYGMEAMSGAVAPLKDVPEFTGVLTKFSNPLLGVLAGMVLTAVIQSSSASVGILQALSVTGSITVASAFPIILGQNIGTCITAIIAAVGTNKNAKRTAVVHLTFNIIGVALAMILFYGANAIFDLPIVQSTANGATIATIHTLFNAFATVVLFPFGKQLEKLACLIIPDKYDDKKEELIDERFLMSPSFALDKVKESCDQMGELAEKNVNLCLDFVRVYSHTMNLNIDDSVKLSKLNHAIGNFERIGDYGANILKLKRRMHNSGIHFSDDANRELEIMSRAVRDITHKAVVAFETDDSQLASEIEPLEQVVDNLKEELRARHAKRLHAGECSVENGMLFFDIINSLERIADHCSNLAVCVIELSNRSYQTHSYLKAIKNKNNEDFFEMFEKDLMKYKI